MKKIEILKSIYKKEVPNSFMVKAATRLKKEALEEAQIHLLVSNTQARLFIENALEDPNYLLKKYHKKQYFKKHKVSKKGKLLKGY